MEPGYRKRIETFDELVDSGLIYGIQKDYEIALNSTLYYEQTKIKAPRFYCSDHNECLERLITHGDITMISVTITADYNALNLIPYYKKRKEVCFID